MTATATFPESDAHWIVARFRHEDVCDGFSVRARAGDKYRSSCLEGRPEGEANAIIRVDAQAVTTGGKIDVGKEFVNNVIRALRGDARKHFILPRGITSNLE